MTTAQERAQRVILYAEIKSPIAVQRSFQIIYEWESPDVKTITPQVVLTDSLVRGRKPRLKKLLTTLGRLSIKAQHRQFIEHHRTEHSKVNSP